MGFETLLGNTRLKDNLKHALARGNISHFYLISGPRGSGKRTLARLLAAAILCRDSDRPCGRCGPCRKVMEGSHPDFITVEDPDHKTVPVKLVREYREDAFIRPNESEHKIYLFPQELGIEGQNALLKILEEPPRYGVFILLTDNPEKLLPTVRSRCRELAMQALPEDVMRRALGERIPKAASGDIDAAIRRSGGWLGQALELLQEGALLKPETESFLRSYTARDPVGLTRTLVGMEKYKRDQVVSILDSWVRILEEALSCRSGMDAVPELSRELASRRTSRELMDGLRSLYKAKDYVLGNVSIGAVCGWLRWELL